ncbi:hypothetical protein F5X99DRAFT_149327 [Biscogniauxia marginata]|nr:hypothetical protein F5X99DRAFT_149327 [Biscogniauxia marginata]
MYVRLKLMPVVSLTLSLPSSVLFFSKNRLDLYRYVINICQDVVALRHGTPAHGHISLSVFLNCLPLRILTGRLFSKCLVPYFHLPIWWMQMQVQLQQTKGCSSLFFFFSILYEVATNPRAGNTNGKIMLLIAVRISTSWDKSGGLLPFTEIRTL